MSRSQRYNDNDDDDNSDYSYEVTSNEDEDDDDDDFQIHKNKSLTASYMKTPFQLSVPQHRHMQYQQQLQHQQPQQNRMIQKQKSKQKMKAKHYHVHPQRKPRRLFTPEEDQLLLSLVEKYGQNSWTDIAEKIPGRSSRQCKERYTTYLCPTVNHSPWNEEEDLLLIQKVHEMGKRWSDMSKFFNGRTANAIKNRYHLHLRGHFNDNRNKHQLSQQHHKDMSVPLCGRSHQQPIQHGSVVMNSISNGFPQIPTTSTASSSPLTAAPPPSTTVFYAYPSTSFNSNTYPSNVNSIILIPSNYEMQTKERGCDVLPNNGALYNSFNGFSQVEPHYTQITPINTHCSSAGPTASNGIDYSYYNYNPNSSSKVNSMIPQYIVSGVNQTFNPSVSVNPLTSSHTSSLMQTNYANERKEISFEPIPQIDNYQHESKKSLNTNSNYQISNFLVKTENSFNDPVVKAEEKPKEGQSKTRILLPPLQHFFPT